MASNGVNVKMGVSGIAQFKQGMKQAQQSVKTLDAELALNEKQYKASGDAEAYMETKAELLKKKLEEQKTAIANAEKALQDMNSNGVDKASTAYQNMQIALARAKGDLIDTETQLGNISTAADDADNDVSEMNETLKNIGKNVSYENVTNALGTITSAMSSVISKAFQLGETLVRNTLGAGEWADELLTTSTQWGITPEALQRMRKTANLIDTDAETILSAQAKLNKNLGTGSKSVTEALTNLMGDTIVSTDPSENFWQIGEAIMNMGDAMSQETYAQALFGKSWRELIPLFTAGKEEYEELYNSWNVVPQDSIDALGKMDDQYQKLQAEIETVKMEFLSELSPAVTSVMTVMTDLVKEFNTYLQTDQGKEMMESLSTAVSSLFDDLSKIDPESVMQSVIGAVEKIKEGLKWIKENKRGVKIAVGAFVGAWAALETAKGVTTALSLINGLKGLSAAKVVSAGASAGSSWGSGFGATVGKAIMAAAPWLAGLMVWGKNAITPQGNDDLWDENGNPTALAQSQGVTWNKDEDDQHGDYYDKLQNGKIVIDARTGKRVEVVDEVEDEDLTDTYTRQQMEDAIQDWWDARRNAENGTEPLEEELSAQDWMEQVLGENFGDVWAQIVQKLDETDQTKLDDIPTNWYSDILDAIVGDDDNEPAVGLNKLPAQMAAAVTGALSGVKVEIDGQAAGNILAPYVSENLGNILAYLTKYGS